MKNITVAVSATTYRDARMWAAMHETSLSKVVAFLLETLPGIKRAASHFPSKNADCSPAKNYPNS
jgi:hypothetical protein